MQLPRFQYVRPASLADGLATLAEHGNRARVMAGGTDLLMNMKYRLDEPAVLISLSDIAELRTIEQQADGSLRIGAGCSLTALAEDPMLAQRYPALRDAIHAVGSRHVRNMATLGGNICLDTRCWYTNQSENWRATREGCFKTDAQLCHAIKSADRCHALNSSDTAPMLIALNASVVLARHGAERVVPLEAFYQDDGIDHTVLEASELLTAVIVPAPTGRSVFAKLAQREGLDFAAGSFAAAVSGGNRHPDSARLVMGCIAPEPKRLTESEEILVRGGLTDEAIEAAALAARPALGEISNLFTMSGYKRRLMKALIRDALVELRAQGD